MNINIHTTDNKYGAILIDPPWAFKTYTKADAIAHRCSEQHYRTMPLHEIAGLPVPDLAAKSCALFLWVVDSHLDVSLDLIKIWGFKYKTIAFFWNKGKIGMGYWTRKQGEICLLATKGSPKRLSKAVRQIIEAPRREHSRKPDEIYSRIEALVDGPYLEMFARQRRRNWVSMGDELDKFPSAA